jgi:hypothetical protein
LRCRLGFGGGTTALPLLPAWLVILGSSCFSVLLLFFEKRGVEEGLALA